MRLSFVEVLALLFTGLAGLATAVQAYVSWEDRGDIAKAIVYAGRIDACADLLTTLSPITEKASDSARADLATWGREEWQPAIVFDVSKNPGEEQAFARYESLLAEWRRASTAFLIIAPETMHGYVAFFGDVIRDDVATYDRISDADFMARLAEIDRQASALRAECRALV